MSKYDETLFFWLKLQDDFFDEPTIRWIEKQPKGKEYAYYYLKLCVKSLKTNGVLIQKVGNLLIPYDEVALSDLTFTDIDTVRIATGLFIKIGLIQKLDNGALYMSQVENLIGSQSKGAFKKQQQRLKTSQREISYQNLEVDKRVDKCPTEKELELELELDVCVEQKCQRNKQIKDETCKDCWHYSECKLPTIAKIISDKDKQKVTEEPLDIVDIEEFFSN